MSTLNGLQDFELLKQKLDSCGYLEQFTDREPQMSKLLAFSIDPFDKYYQNINLKDKRLLTVLSGGDQWLDGVSRKVDQSNIVTYDINRLSIHYTYMKLLSIVLHQKNSFKYSDFDNLKTFFLNEKEYERYRLMLPAQIQVFWDLFYSNNFYNLPSFSGFVVDLPWHSAEY